MGRLTLNVLLSFAQFEREVIGERVRNAASKRKGLWVGGPVPLGYRCVDKKLEIVPEEAEVVRTIFGSDPHRAIAAPEAAEANHQNIPQQNRSRHGKPPSVRHVESDRSRFGNLEASVRSPRRAIDGFPESGTH
jgi:DNA invertase Pin-like site-specific DNA recombinase